MIIQGNCLEILKTLDDEIVQCVVTSPPYFALRNYEIDGQIGMEETPEEYILKLVEIFREVHRILKKDGTFWLNIGDSYAGSNQGVGAKKINPLQFANRGTNFMHDRKKSLLSRLPGYKPKDLIGIPWMLAFALRNDGWWLRQDIIWHKPSCMPESVKDRCTRNHEYIFLLTKNKKYYYDIEAVKTPCKGNWGTRDRKLGKYHNEGTGLNPHTGLDKEYEKANLRSVWSITVKPFKGGHYATFPPELPEICIKAGSKEGDTILDPFVGTGTTCIEAKKLKRKYIGIDINPEYIKITKERIKNEVPDVINNPFMR